MTAARRRRLRLLIGLVWIALLAGLVLWVWQQGLTVREIMRLTYDYVVNNPIAPVIYIVIYALRPLTFFPAVWLTIAGGSLFGFIPGLFYAFLGEQASAQTGYLLARFFRSDVGGDVHSDRNPRIAGFRRKLIKQSFPTVLVLRASYLPLDLVNYACGLLHVPWLPYTAANVIGMLPPLVTFVSFGATIKLPALLKQQNFSPSELIDSTQLMISAGLIVASAVIAFIAHRRRNKLATEDTNGK
jgi:uncharacterized membrane protein YdjX (TVP38/TMEM64 family)